MLGFVQNWFAPKANPIGVDFGSDALRMAQVRLVDGEHRMVAAASADVPPHVRGNLEARWDFFVETVRDLLSQNSFSGRQAVLALPAAGMHIQHLRMARMDDEAMKKAVRWEARGKIPIDPNAAVLRHHVAGEIFGDTDPQQEVIVMAAARDMVEEYLASAARARLDIVGMNVEARAVADCFVRVHRRKGDAEATTLYVDIGCAGSRATIVREGRILFARAIPVAGDYFGRGVAAALGIGIEEAKVLRIKLNDEGISEQVRLGDGLINEPSAAGADDQASMRERVEAAIHDPLGRLIEELDLCRRYYEATFPSKPVERLIFVGGEARQTRMCQRIAQELGLAAQVGDPMVRMSRTSEIGIESGMDRRLPQPAWAVAIGLSMGPLNGDPAAASAGMNASAKA